ncbi:MAG: ATP-grasp domain-containing protein [Methylobacterium sp.]
MREGDAVLIAAQSGRALAQAARRAGLRPYVLDLFGDADTLELADAHRTLPGRFGTGRHGTDAVLRGLEALAGLAGNRTLGVILGSGFEGSPRLMARIAARHRLIGAGPGTVAALKDPMLFAALCERLAIPHPPVSTAPRVDRAAWLTKRAGGSGGSHIRTATAGAAPPEHYFQARVPGRACALNFLADGRNVAVLSFTEQWSRPSALRPFRFAGAIAPGRHEPSRVPADLLAAMTDAIARLIQATALRGLASADLLVDGGSWWLLEINPRPGATLDALDRRPTPLLAAHIEASLGCMPRLDAPPVDAAGSEICYAARRYASVQPLDWPDFTRDRPRDGSFVARDAPFCTVTAHGLDTAAVRHALRERAGTIAALLDGRTNQDGYRYQAAEHQQADGPADRQAGRRR